MHCPPHFNESEPTVYLVPNSLQYWKRKQQRVYGSKQVESPICTIHGTRLTMTAGLDGVQNKEQELIFWTVERHRLQAIDKRLLCRM